MLFLRAALVAVAAVGPFVVDAADGGKKANLRQLQNRKRERFPGGGGGGFDEVRAQGTKKGGNNGRGNDRADKGDDLLREDDTKEEDATEQEPMETYIVTFKKESQSLMAVGPSALCHSMALQANGAARKVYSKAVSGCSVDLTPSAAKELKKNGNIETIEKNGIVTASTLEYADPPSWGLDRIDQEALPLDQTGTRHDATGVKVYILDTGLRGTHQDLASSISSSACHFSAFTGADADPLYDGNGHGTHVGSTACGAEYGVSQNCDLCAVKVLSSSGSGSWDGVISGIDFVAANCDAPKGCVINMSLGGGFSQAINDAVQGAVDAGVTVVVAAGNENTDACTKSPASAEGAVTVGSTDRYDARSSFSNYGACTDIYAPGSSITAAWMGSDTDTTTISGTSMASPHVAGLAAAILGLNPGMTPAAVAAKIALHSKRICTGTGTSCDPDNGYIDLATSVDLCEGCTAPPSPPPTPAPPTPPPTPCQGMDLTVKLFTDQFPSETSWTLTNTCTGQLHMSGSGYSSDETMHTEEGCVPEGEYEFTISDSYGDGICCTYGDGYYEVLDGTGAVMASGGAFADAETTTFGSCGGTSPPGTADPTPSPSSPPATPEPSPGPTAPPSPEPSPSPTAPPSPEPSPSPTSPPSTGSTPFPTPLSRPCGEAMVAVRVVTDDHPEDSSWTITDVCTGEVVRESPEYVDASRNHFDSFCLPESQYRFTIEDSWGDGLGEGVYEVYYNSNVIATGSDFGREESASFGEQCAE